MTLTATYDLDVTATATVEDLEILAGDQTRVVVRVLGLNATDTVDQMSFTAKPDASDADNDSTTVQKVIGPNTSGESGIRAVPLAPRQRLGIFTLSPDQTTALMSCTVWCVRVWVTSDGVQQYETSARGGISARLSGTELMTLLFVGEGALVGGAPAVAATGSQIFSGPVAVTSDPPAMAAAGSQIFSGPLILVGGAPAVAATGRHWLYSYTPGDSLAGGTFARSTTAYYQDVNGIWQSAAINVVRDAWYLGGVRHLVTEPQRTNVVTWCRDLTNAAWVSSGITPTKDQVGIDGTASSATRLTATGTNGTCLQSITLGSSARYQSAFVKRVTGVGTISMTMDNGATWTTLTITSSWARYTIPTQTLANPTVGFRIATSGDEIAVDFVQNEDAALGTTISSPILTTSAAVTRGADLLYLPYVFPPVEATAYIKETAIGANSGRQLFIGNAGETGNQWNVAFTSGGSWRCFHSDGAASVSSIATITPTLGDTTEKRSTLFADGSVQIGYALNGGAETNATQSATKVLPGAWADTRLYLGGTSVGPSFSAIRRIVFTRGVATLVDMRAF